MSLEEISYEEAVKALGMNEKAEAQGAIVNIERATAGGVSASDYRYEDALRLLGFEGSLSQSVQESSIRVRAVRLGGLLNEAESEIELMMKGIEKGLALGIEEEKNLSKRLKAERYVLRNLPLQDQISEMEKILVILDEGTLNREQLKTVKSEIAGLYEGLKHEKEHETEFERGLASIRERRLAEVMQKLRAVDI